MLSQEELRSILYKSIEKNDVEGVRKALEQGAVPINHGCSRNRSLAIAISSDCSIDLMKLLIEKGAKIVDENDGDVSDLFVSVNHEQQHYVTTGDVSLNIDKIKFLLDKGAVIINDLSGLKNEIINIVHKCINGNYNHLRHFCGIGDNRQYDEIKCKIGIRYDLIDLVAKLIGKNSLKTYITTYTENNRIIKITLSLCDPENPDKYIYHYEHDTTLQQVFDGPVHDKMVDIAQLIISHNTNSIVSDNIHVKTIIIEKDRPQIENNIDLKNEGQYDKRHKLSTAYQIARFIFMQMIRCSIQDKKKRIVELIKLARECGIKPNEILKTAEQYSDDWQKIIEINLESNGVKSSIKIATDNDFAPEILSVPIEYGSYLEAYENTNYTSEATCQMRIMESVKMLIRFNLKPWEELKEENDKSWIEAIKSNIEANKNFYLNATPIYRDHSTLLNYIAECISYQGYKEGAVVGLFKSANTDDDSNKEANWQMLPPEIGTKISEYLSIKDGCRVVQTCKSAHEIAKEKKKKKFDDLSTKVDELQLQIQIETQSIT